MPTVKGVARTSTQAQAIQPQALKTEPLRPLCPGESLETGMEILSSWGRVSADRHSSVLGAGLPRVPGGSCHDGHTGGEVTSTKVVCLVAEAQVQTQLLDCSSASCLLTVVPQAQCLCGRRRW